MSISPRARTFPLNSISDRARGRHALQLQGPQGLQQCYAYRFWYHSLWDEEAIRRTGSHHSVSCRAKPLTRGCNVSAHYMGLIFEIERILLYQTALLCLFASLVMLNRPNHFCLVFVPEVRQSRATNTRKFVCAQLLRRA